ncbi:MAG: FAD-binding protein [Thermoleophilia bacterium]|nr:FAD-binding protein [Thermoleophilia bacterium]
MKQEKTDVVVMAAGLSGLAAAISAAENGAKVIAFEKAGTTGGAANMGMGPLGVGSRFQRHHMISITPGEAFRKHMNFTHWRVDPRLVREIYFKSGETIDWLEDMGVEFLTVTPVYPTPEILRPYATSEPTWHVVKPADGSTQLGPRMAGPMLKAMTERAEDLEVDIRLNTPVKDLIKEEGRVVGVIAEDQNGEKIEARAKAVIVATGGAGDNPKMIKEYTGYEWGKDLFSFRVPGMDGDGLNMAWEVGAAKTDVLLEIMYLVPENLATPNNFIIDGAFRQPCLWVNSKGRRFMNEDAIANTTFAGNAIATQPGKFAYSIFDSALLKKYKKRGSDITSHVHPLDMFDHFEEAVDGALAAGYKHVFKADGLKELAEQSGIDPEVLAETVEEYNDLCDGGFDELFEKDHRYLQLITKPPYYACRYFPSAYGTLGGIRINHKAEVLDEDYEPIPGLYAAGLDACTIYGDSYPFILPGNTMGFALNSGRIAGENAAQQ